MKYKKIVKFAALNIVMIIILLVLVFHQVFNQYQTRYINFILHGFKIIYIIDCFIILRVFKFKKISLGCIFITVSWTWNFVTLYLINHINAQVFNLLDFLLYNLTGLIGVILIMYGIWLSLRENVRLIEKLNNIAYYNPVTHLPNRNYVMNTNPLNKIRHYGKEFILGDDKQILHKERKSTIIYLDIDDFKLINDNLGHHYGDILLRKVAKRLKSCLKEGDLIIHLSGDEFLLICHDVYSREDAKSLAFDLLKSMKDKYILNDKEVYMTCSLGIALYPKHGDSIDEVMKKADVAMYEAKKAGKNAYYIHNDSLEKTNKDKFDTINELKTSIENEDFVIFYQYKAKTTSLEITGLEALVRWNHPKHGLIGPNKFIPLAEQVGLIKEIDCLVLHAVCRQIKKWMDENKIPFHISVNISPLFFNDQHFIPIFDQIISQYEIDTTYISIEITENIALNDLEQTKKKLKQLKSRNIKVSLDDFGKGYSSLNYIKEFPIDYLKIDKSFIDGICKHGVEHALVTTIVNISSLLGFIVVFEGVETQEQLNLLKKMGAHEFQGYILNKPQPIENIK